MVEQPGDDKRVRRLPTLYVGKEAMFIDRDLSLVRRQLGELVNAIHRSRQRPTYMIQPCEFAGRRGLYGRDFLNRARYRRILVREGMTFARDRFPRLTESGAFECDDWGEFVPEFLVMADYPETGPDVKRTHPSAVNVALASVRLGAITSVQELRLCIELSRRIETLSTREPLVLANALRERSEQALS